MAFYQLQSVYIPHFIDSLESELFNKNDASINYWHIRSDSQSGVDSIPGLLLGTLRVCQHRLLLHLHTDWHDITWHSSVMCGWHCTTIQRWKCTRCWRRRFSPKRANHLYLSFSALHTSTLHTGICRSYVLWCYTLHTPLRVHNIHVDIYILPHRSRNV